MPHQVEIVDALHDWAIDVGTVTGWQTRGDHDFDPHGHVCHHDAIPTRWTSPPSLLVAGRSDLAGPLCNFALSSTGKVWLVAAGRANHAGEGSWRGLVGNSSVWGTEAQNAGTGQMWPDEQIDAYQRLCAATADYSGFDASMVCRHAEWTSRKIDPAGPWEGGGSWETDMDAFRTQVRDAEKEDLFMGANAQDVIDQLEKNRRSMISQHQKDRRSDLNREMRQAKRDGQNTDEVVAALAELDAEQDD